MFVSRKGLAHEFKSAGDGLWGLDADVSIKYTQIDIHICEWGDEYDDEKESDQYCVEIVARHDLPFVDEGPYGALLNTNQTANGLLYTDTAATDALHTLLRADPLLSKLINVAHVGGSEQGMQQEDGFSCDADLTVSLDEFKMRVLQEAENDDTLEVI